MSDNVLLKRVQQHWNARTETPTEARPWWTNQTIREHINRRLCGIEGLRGVLDGSIEFLRTAPEAPFGRAISVGCGNGHFELQLASKGIVDRFELFEISDARVRQVQDKIDGAGLNGRVTVHHADAFRTYSNPAAAEPFDLVFWCGSLHHMFDARGALEWSRDLLRPGGSLYMFEYVGASKFQWGDDVLAILRMLNYVMVAKGWISPAALNKPVDRPTLEAMERSDPSEAADSSAIVPALFDLFDVTDFRLAGGIVYLVYLTALKPWLLADMDPALVRKVMDLDDALNEAGHFVNCAAYARKRAGATVATPAEPAPLADALAAVEAAVRE